MGSIPSRASPNRVIEVLGNGYTTDRVSVLYQGEPMSPQPRVKTFEVLPLNPGWARDGKHLYYRGFRMFPDIPDTIV